MAITKKIKFLYQLKKILLIWFLAPKIKFMESKEKKSDNTHFDFKWKFDY
jgi:hypothetical protein